MINNRNLADAAFGTHITPLMAAVLATKGNVVEMGMGDYSTPLLHEIIKHQRCLNSKRKLFSFESDAKWLDNFTDLRNDWHTLESVADWNKLVLPKQISVLFIDHAPANRRIIDIEKYKDIAQIIVVHDTDKPNYYGYEPTLSEFKSCFVYERYRKSTTIVSNFINVSKIL